jgi:hypothetical protein
LATGDPLLLRDGDRRVFLTDQSGNEVGAPFPMRRRSGGAHFWPRSGAFELPRL